MVVTKTVNLDGVRLLLQWAAREGWNPGIGDAELFYGVDPQGFVMAYDGDEPVSGISVVRTGQGHGFLGLYICRPDYRGQGYGMAVWQEGMRKLGSRVVGLDGVPEQQYNYRKSGFETAYRNIRYQGRVDALLSFAETTEYRRDDLHCIPARLPQIESMVGMDARIHGFRREGLLASWAADSESRLTLVCLQAGSLVGFGTIRQCLQGHKVGPLTGRSKDVAKRLMLDLARLSGAEEIILDVPEPNKQASALAEEADLEPVFETARMFCGPAPGYRLDGLFGVTSFELG